MIKQLSSLESKTMNIIWDLKQCSVREVKNQLDQTKNLAYTTVATIIQRLYSKGMLKRLKKGPTAIYSPKLTKVAYSKNIARTFIDKLYDSFGNVALVSFAESLEDLSKPKKQFLLKLLEKYENK